jgi:preprotein translocase subunit SecF
MHTLPQAKILSLVGIILFFYSAMIALTLTIVPIERRAFFVGIIADVFNTAMYAAPLSVMVRSSYIDCTY